MKRMGLYGFVLLLIGLIGFFPGISTSLLAQDSTASGIQVSTHINATKVPLNRTLQLEVTITWPGDPDRFDLISFDNPALTNLQIVGTATASRTEVDRVYKEYTYTLKPSELGMAYIEGVLIKVHDRTNDREQTLVTQRIPVEVIDPIPEPGEGGIGWLLYAFVAALVLGGGSIAFILQKKKKSRQLIEETPPPLAEEIYLNRLRKEIQLNQPDLRTDFSRLTKIAREYLTVRFSIPAKGLTTGELVQQLNEIGLDDNRIQALKEAFQRSDEITYSGSEGTHEELNRFYTIIETMLLDNLKKQQMEPTTETSKS